MLNLQMCSGLKAMTQSILKLTAMALPVRILGLTAMQVLILHACSGLKALSGGLGDQGAHGRQRCRSRSGG